jgi:hypothetical protein
MLSDSSVIAASLVMPPLNALRLGAAGRRWLSATSIDRFGYRRYDQDHNQEKIRKKRLPRSN